MPRSLRLLPILFAAIAFGWVYLTSETFTNPETGKKAHVGLSDTQEQQLGLQSFREVVSESNLVQSGPAYELVRKVAARLIRVVDTGSRQYQWQVAVVENPAANAFCLPGGKIVVYTGILPITQNEAGLATVMGHEIAHATSRHGAQRVFQQNAMQIAMMGVQGSMADMDYGARQQVLGLLGAGAQYGVLLPFSRKHELEADRIGLKYMARAGYDPREAIAFWERMKEASQGKKPPEIASTHPADETRIRQLQELMPAAFEEYRKATGSSANGWGQ
ncbi:MAG: M48 family metallopeptidase [Chthoniobacterales bacterium]